MKYKIFFLLSILSSAVLAQGKHYLVPALNYRLAKSYDCNEITWLETSEGNVISQLWTYKLNWSKLENDLCEVIGVSKSEFESIYGDGSSSAGFPNMSMFAYDEACQYVPSKGSSQPYEEVSPVNACGVFTITDPNADPSGGVLTWSVNTNQAYQFFMAQGETTVTRYLKFTSNNTPLYQHLYVSFTVKVRGFAEVNSNGLTVKGQEQQLQLQKLRSGDLNEDGTVSIKDITDLVNKELLLPKSKPESVDLGLSVKWATCNVGAACPEDYGDYFAWGETKRQTNNSYSWTSYKWCAGDLNTLTKYCATSSCGNVDGKLVLEPEDDAATANWGSDWRMPTKTEFDELLNSSNCTWTWDDNKHGYNVTSKKNGNSIFLPAARFRGVDSLQGLAWESCYWTSSLPSAGGNNAYCVNFYSGNVDWNAYKRCYGFPVRPVQISK